MLLCFFQCTSIPTATPIPVKGTGATFPDKVYQQLNYLYSLVNTTALVTYTGTGSGTGKASILANTVDFAGSDSLLTEEEYTTGGDLQMIPVVAGAVTFVYNLPELDGIGFLTLDRTSLVDIYDGSINRWDHATIKSLNPDVADKLPNQPIIVTYRGDSSGTTEIVTKALSSFSSTWKSSVGSGPKVTWPVKPANSTGCVDNKLSNGIECNGIEASSGSALVSALTDTKYSIGYMVLNEAISSDVKYINLKNKYGTVVEPRASSIQLSVDEFTPLIGDRLTGDLVDTSTVSGYSITGFTYLIVRMNSMSNCTVAESLFTYVKWLVTSEHAALRMANFGFSAIPSSLASKVVHILETGTCGGLKILPSTTSLLTVNGGGASLPADLYSQLFSLYRFQRNNVTFVYTFSSSTAGITDITDKKLDFAGSDSILTDAQKAADGDLQLIPMVAGAVGCLYNIPEILGETDPLILDRTVLANIWLGTVNRWNDASIQALNPTLAAKLPNQKINLVYRTSSSGTTEIFTSSLSSFSTTWQTNHGSGKTMAWPVKLTTDGTCVAGSSGGIECNGYGATSTSDTFAKVRSTVYSLGYVSYKAESLGLRFIKMKNKAGSIVEPSFSTIYHSLTDFSVNIKLTSLTSGALVDSGAVNAWPMAALTYWAIRMTTYTDCAKAFEIAKFITWTNENSTAKEIIWGNTFSDVPATVVNDINTRLSEMKCQGASVLNIAPNMILSGQGATFPFNLYVKLFRLYKASRPKSIFTYTGTGSTAGKTAMINRASDFAGTDSVLSEAEKASAPDLQLIPIAASAIVFIFNIPGITTSDPKLILSRDVVASIFLGTITKWNDNAIIALNPSLSSKLPNNDIQVVVRADGSGTTEILTRAFSSFSTTWKSSVGFGSTVTWPTRTQGKGFEASGSSDLSRIVYSNDYSIGFVVLEQALSNSLVFADVVNFAGEIVSANSTSIGVAVADFSSTINTDLSFFPVDSRTITAYPIVGVTYVVVSLNSPTGSDCSKVSEVFRFLLWVFSDPVASQTASESGFSLFRGTVKTIAENKLATALCNKTAIDGNSATVAKVNGRGSKVGESFYVDSTFYYTFKRSVNTFDYSSLDDNDEGSALLASNAIDFYSTNVALNSTELARATDFQHIPVAAYSMIFIYSIAGITSSHPALILNKTVIADIYLGKINRWNDPALLEINPGLKDVLPNSKIIVHVRTDQCSENHIISSSLGSFSSEFRDAVPVSFKPTWPIKDSANCNGGTSVNGIECNAANAITSSQLFGNVVTGVNGIGYISSGGVEEQSSEKFFKASMINSQNNVVEANSTTVAASQQGTTVKRVFRENSVYPRATGNELVQNLIDTNGNLAYPISFYQYVVIRTKNMESASTASILYDYLKFASTDSIVKTRNNNFGVVSPDTKTASSIESLLDQATVNGQPASLRTCVAGEYKSAINLCVKCPAGQYSTEQNSKACLPCAAGTFSTEGSSICSSCDFGTYNPSLGQAQCQQCPKGTSGPLKGLLACIECPRGEYSSEDGTTKCEKCPKTQYGNTTKSTSCLYCPLNTESFPGATNITDCVCKSDYYNSEQKVGEACTLCPQFGICEGGSKLPYPSEGYWGEESNPFKFIECFAKGTACKQNFTCGEGYTEKLCDKCADNYFKFLGSHFCTSCESIFSSQSALVYSIFLVVIIYLWVLVNNVACGHLESFDIALAFVQVTDSIGVMNLEWGKTVEFFFSACAVMNFSVDIVSPDCLFRFNGSTFVTVWTLQMIIPIVVVFIYSLIYFKMWYTVKREREKHELTEEEIEAQNVKLSLKLDHCIYSVISFFKICYQELCLKSIQALVCLELPDGTFSLRADPQMECWGSEHTPIGLFSLLAIFGYVIGVPLVFFKILYQGKRSHLLHDPKFLNRYGCLSERYNDHFYWWEMMFMFRKFIIVVFAITLPDFPFLQATLSLVSLTLLFAVHVYARAFTHFSLNFIEGVFILVDVGFLTFGIARTSENATEVIKSSTTVLIWLLAALSVVIIIFFLRFELQSKLIVKKAIKEIYGLKDGSISNDSLVLHDDLVVLFRPEYISNWLKTASEEEKEEFAELSSQIVDSWGGLHGEMASKDECYTLISKKFPFLLDMIMDASETERKEFVKTLQSIHKYFSDHSGTSKMFKTIIREDHMSKIILFMESADEDGMTHLLRIFTGLYVNGETASGHHLRVDNLNKQEVFEIHAQEVEEKHKQKAGAIGGLAVEQTLKKASHFMSRILFSPIGKENKIMGSAESFYGGPSLSTLRMSVAHHHHDMPTIHVLQGNLDEKKLENDQVKEVPSDDIAIDALLTEIQDVPTFTFECADECEAHSENNNNGNSSQPIPDITTTDHSDDENADMVNSEQPAENEADIPNLIINLEEVE
eukprot:Nk52_evm56s224 gene=Nk52_evmTU56s224